MIKILVVEDDAMVRGSLIDILTSAEYQVAEAINGRAALEKIEENLPDLIISDIMMPEMDGYSLLNEIQKKYINVEIPFIFLSAKAEFNDIREGMNTGADDYLTKPFKARDLLKAVNVRLAKKQNHSKALDDIADSIARYVPHELRTPLVSILGYTDCILNDHESFSKEEIILMVSNIKDSGERLLNRIQKFISFAELNTVSDEIGRSNDERVSFKKVLNRSLQNFSSRFPDINYTFNCDDVQVNIPEYILVMLSDELIENAFKFSINKSEVCIHFYRESESYVLEIKNSSNFKIPYSELRAIPTFKQFDRETNQQIGNGIGLSIVKKICELFNIHSKISNGDSTIKIELIFNVNNNITGVTL